jgi:ribonuclease P protein subunit POP4
MRNAENILRHELIGLECEIVSASNKNANGIKGKIVDETMKTVVIESEKKSGSEGNRKAISNTSDFNQPRKVVEKKGTIFRLKLDKETVDVDGNFIIARPEDRIKKKIKKW